MESELEALRRDLARFERRTRLIWLGSLAAAVLIAVFWGGARQAQSQTASLSGRALVLVDDATRQRIVLASDTANRPGIWLRDESGRDRFFFGFGAQRETPQFSMNDEGGRPRVNAGFSIERGDPLLTLSDQTGVSRVYFGFGVQLRTPQIVLNDERGKDRLYAGWTRDGTTIIDLIDDAGNVVWKAGGTRQGGTGPGTPSGGNPGATRKSGGP